VKSTRAFLSPAHRRGSVAGFHDSISFWPPFVHDADQFVVRGTETLPNVVILTKRTTRADGRACPEPCRRDLGQLPICHPDRSSRRERNWRDLGQLRASEAGSGSMSLHPRNASRFRVAASSFILSPAEETGACPEYYRGGEAMLLIPSPVRPPSVILSGGRRSRKISAKRCSYFLQLLIRFPRQNLRAELSELASS